MPTEVLFDDRSALLPRTTGWERYVRGLVGEVATWRHDTDPRVRLLSSDRAEQFLTQPVVGDFLAWSAARRSSLTHFPTFPPLSPRGDFIVTLHDLAWWKHPETASKLGRAWYRGLCERSLSRARIIITHTRSVAHEASDHFDLPLDRFHVVSPGVDLPRARENWRVSQKPFILAVGSVEPRKNLEALVRAYDRSTLGQQGIELVLAGRSAWGRLPPGVQLVSGLNDSEIAACYRDAVGLVLPSLCEGFGLPAVEAQASACPVACSDLAVLREVTGNHAIYFDPHDDAAITASLEVLVTTSATDEAVGNARSFTWLSAGDQLRQAYVAAGT